MTEEPVSSTHPLIPPTTEDDRLSWIRLLRSRRVGIATFYRLLADHGTAAAALAALPGIAAAAGVENYEPCPPKVALAEARQARAAGARMICRGEALYPPALAEIADAPPFVWAVGAPDLLTRPMVALVGARNASSLGTRMARTLARGLTEAGCVVVSGLARGIDTVAHHAALDGGTLAVMAGGVDIRYPAENAGLAAEIATKGLLLSEQPMGLSPIARHFPTRNRIVSGLSRAVVVVEAAPRSGSLITARCALDQGREVLAVPGHPFDARAGGCNILIRDGATLVRSAEDVIEALGPLVATQTLRHMPTPDTNLPPQRQPRPRDLPTTAALHSQILSRLGPAPVAEDQLRRDLGVPAPVLSPALTELELTGEVERQPGGLVTKPS